MIDACDDEKRHASRSRRQLDSDLPVPFAMLWGTQQRVSRVMVGLVAYVPDFGSNFRELVCHRLRVHPTERLQKFSSVGQEARRNTAVGVLHFFREPGQVVFVQICQGI